MEAGAIGRAFSVFHNDGGRLHFGASSGAASIHSLCNIAAG